MESKEIVTDGEIKDALCDTGFDNRTIAEGRLSLLELLSKAGAGYYNSHTEENYLKWFGLMQKNRLPNKRGRRFICAMIYTHSNRKPESYFLMQKFRS